MNTESAEESILQSERPKGFVEREIEELEKLGDGDNDVLLKCVELPEYVDDETESKLVSHYGGGLIRSILKKIAELREATGLTQEDFQIFLLWTLNRPRG